MLKYLLAMKRNYDPTTAQWALARRALARCNGYAFYSPDFANVLTNWNPIDPFTEITLAFDAPRVNHGRRELRRGQFTK